MATIDLGTRRFVRAAEPGTAMEPGTATAPLLGRQVRELGVSAPAPSALLMDETVGIGGKTADLPEARALCVASVRGTRRTDGRKFSP